MWTTVKQWFLEVCSVRSSELSSMALGKVTKWRNNLDSIQSVNLHDSESPLDSTSALTNSSLQQLVNPDDSASQITEIVSESNLQTGSNIVYDITDKTVYNQIMENPAVYEYFDIVDRIHYVVGDTLLTVDPSIFNSFI